MKTNPANFQREVSPFPRSLAAFRFRMDSRTINQHYWVATLAEGGLSSVIRNSIRQGNEQSNPIEVLTLPAQYERRIPSSMAGLGEEIKVHQRWYRLTTLVMLSAALERYLNDVSRTAIQSDPSISPGFPKRLDGLFLEKYGIRLPRVEHSNLIVGDWNSRSASYGSTFGGVPKALADNVHELESMRKLRNRIAHSMGFDDGFDEQARKSGALNLAAIAMSRTNPAALETARLSHERLLKLMAISQQVVDGIDKNLMEDFIGSYEITSMYMSWCNDPNSFEKSVGFQTPNNHKKGQFAQSKLAYAKRVFAHTLNFSWTARYFEQMETYISKL